MEIGSFGLTNSELLENRPQSLLEREGYVLRNGLADGLSKVGSSTAADLSRGWEDFKANPLSATGRYIADHWQDTAVGAAITFIHPKKWANLALVGFSLRGVGYSSWDAMTAAADAGSDLDKVGKQFAEALSHEGTAFVSSLPMAMLGGQFGRAGANAVFGKGHGLYDFGTGRVGLADVKQNLWAIHDTLRPPKIKLVVTDMDNTLAPFSKYFAEGLKKNMPELARKTGIAEAELYRDIGHHMEVMRSHDYPWSLELALGKRLKVGEPGGMSLSKFEAEIADPFWRSMGESMRRHHYPFEGVVETLQTLKDRKIPVVVLSDAPAFIGLKRLQNLKLDNGLIERMFALRNWHEPEALTAELRAAGQARLDNMLSAKHGLKEFLAIPAEFEKPNPAGFRMLLERYDVRPRQALMIGDSRVKDVGVAHQAGSRGIWARYGQADLADEAVLARLRPLPEGGTPGARKTYAPMLAQLDSYRGLLDHLEPRANPRAIVSGAAASLLVQPELRTTIVGHGLLPDKNSR